MSKAGLYGLIVLAILAVFLAGLMVGRTPEYLGKKIGRREITLVALYVLAVPFALLIGAGLATSFDGPKESILNTGPHGFSEVLYAFTSASNNNGGGFAGIGVGTTFYNTALAWPCWSAGSCRSCLCSRWLVHWPASATLL